MTWHVIGRQAHDTIAGRGVSTLFVNKLGQQFNESTFPAYFSKAINRWTAITERLIPRTLRYMWCTAAGEGGVLQEEAWDVAMLMAHHANMWPRSGSCPCVANEHGVTHTITCLRPSPALGPA